MKKQIITGAICGGIGVYIGYKLACKAVMKLLSSEELAKKLSKEFEKGFENVYDTNYKMEELIFNTIEDAEKVIDDLNEVITKYDYASVSDLYDIAGITGSYRSNKYGWTELVNSKIATHKNGYIIKIDEPKILK